MTVNENLANINTTHQHQVERFKRGVSATLLALFKQLERELKSSLLEFPLEKWTVAVKNTLLKRLEAIRSKSIANLNKELIKNLKDLNAEEITFYTDQLDNVLADADIMGITVNKPDLEKSWDKTKRGDIIFDDGQMYSLTAFLNVFNDRNQLYLKQAVTKAQKQKLDLVATSALLFSVGGLFRRSEAQINPWSATALQYSSGFGRDLAYQTNSDILRGYAWQSVLDSRTSDVCRHNAGKYWLYNRPDLSTLDSEQYPPIHYHCRSTTAPITKSYEEMGLDPTDGLKTNLNGDIPKETTYNAWLVAQPTRIQKDALGPVRYELWRSGEVDIDAFYTRDGRQLSLLQLREKGVEFPDAYLRYVN